MRASALQYANAWYEQLTESAHKEWGGISRRMIELIHEEGKMRLLPEVVRLVQERELAEQGVTRVTVRSAHEVEEAVIEEQLKKVLPKAKVKIEKELDPSIVGGIQIETANRRWDLSLRGQLRSLRNEIKSQ